VPASDIDIAVVDSLKVLDLKQPIREADIRRTVQNDEPGADLIDRAERTRQDPRNSDEAANSGGLGFAKIHRLLRNALDDVTAEFRHLVAERQEILEGC
jgi:hypothetical protein